MSQATVNEFVIAIKEDPNLMAELNAAIDVESYYKVAQDHGYFFTSEELKAELDQESQEELAGMTERRGASPWLLDMGSSL